MLHLGGDLTPQGLAQQGPVWDALGTPEEEDLEWLHNPEALRSDPFPGAS